MKETNSEESLNIADVLSKSEVFFEKNRKTILVCVAAVAVVVVGFFALRHFYFQPREVRAAEDMFVAEMYFSQGQFEQALNGDSLSMGFLEVIDAYGCTKSGNLARYYAAVCQMNLGQFDQALSLLKKYKGRDLLTKAEAEMLRGDAEAELERYDEALSHYEKAAKINPNVLVAPAAMFKAALVLVKQGDKKRAVELLEGIRRDYPESTEANEVDKYIGYIEAME